MNILFYLCLLILLIINTKQSDDYYFLDLISKNSSICDLRITTDNFIIFDKCELSQEWKLYYEKTTSQNALEVYENKETPIRVINFEYIIDNHKTQPDIKFTNIEIKSYFNKIYIDNINISNPFPLYLKKGDNFDVIIEYGNLNYTYINLVISIFMKNDLDSSITDLNFGYSKILFNEYYEKTDLSYLFLVIFFIIFIFLLRLKFLIEENQFIVIHIDEIMQGKNAETIFVVVGLLLTILLFFMIIKYIYYITFVFSILLAIISVKSFYKYFFKIICPSCSQNLDVKYLIIKFLKIEYSNIIFYPISILTIILWYNLSDDNLDLHTYLNDIIFFTIVYFNVHKLNLKNFFIITGISFAVIIYQVIKIVLDEDKIQKDKDNVYYITTRFIIDVPIRFILKDFLESPFEEIYFFSILDITLIGYVIHYCEYTYHLSKIYLMISIYGAILGLIINLFLFYGLKFSPPMSLIPLFISIVSLIIYSIHKKQFFDFMDLEKDEGPDFQDIEEIQEIKENQNEQIELFKKNEDFNISFKDNEIFKDETEIDKLKEQKEDNEEEEIDEEKKHEEMIKQFAMKINSNQNLSSKKIRKTSLDQNENERNKQFVSSMGQIGNINDNNNFISLSPKNNDKNMSLPDLIMKSNLKNKNIKNVEMKILDNNEDKKDSAEKKENKNKKEN